MDGPHADIVEPIILKPDTIIVPSICFYEVYKVTLRKLGKTNALDCIGLLALSKEILIDKEIALTAAQINAERKLPMADSLIYATALKYEATLWTKDSDFDGLPGVNYFEK